MSRVYFHSPRRTAELKGSERAWLASLVKDIALGVLDVRDADRVRRLHALIHPEHTMAQTIAASTGRISDWSDRYRLYFSVDWDNRAPLVQYEGKPISTFSLQLNTASLLGSDQVKLAARLHGQCEIHAWVDGPNRAWLADIMQAGLDNGTYRRGLRHNRDPADGQPADVWISQGWEDVIGLLRERDDEPVVTSYSVTDSFPNSSVGEWMPLWPEGRAQHWDALTEEQQRARSDRSDAWYELEQPEQWRIAMEGLRGSSDGLEIKPDDWATFRFTHRLTVLDLLAPDWEERLIRALTAPEDQS